MSWPLASFAIVAGALLLGWFAYERARPSARMIALVATLAALAALGRDAFVALPDVKPITAMTFVIGYGLGPLAGFTVGAVGMLESNIVLGQGPYTPWQMLAWGIVGLLGAVLGRFTGRRASRLTLACACAASALCAKEIMNVYTWTIGGVYTPAAMLARVVEGLPFDLTDTAASFLFGLAFAPELARLLARMRARMEVHWSGAEGADLARARRARGAAPAARGTATLILLALALSVTQAAHPASTSAASGEYAAELSYLGQAQNADGGFGEARGRKSSELYSAWAAMGLAAVGEDPLGLKHGGRSVLDSLRGEASTLEGVGDVERTILALHACGVPAKRLGPLDLEAKLLTARRPDGSFSDQVNLTAFAIFALRAQGRAARERTIQRAASWLEREQDSDGGYGFARRASGSEIDDTGAAIQAIVAAGDRPRGVLARAVSYIRRAQNPDGGFPEGPGGESNAQSTAWAVQGLLAAGGDVETLRRGGRRSPLGYLRTLVAPDGSVRYSRTSAQTPVWVTAQALLALARKPFPIAPPRVHRASLSATASQGLAPAGVATRGAVAAVSGRGTARTAIVPPPRAAARGVAVSTSGALTLSAVCSTVAASLTSVAERALTPIGVAGAGAPHR